MSFIKMMYHNEVKDALKNYLLATLRTVAAVAEADVAETEENVVERVAVHLDTVQRLALGLEVDTVKANAIVFDRILVAAIGPHGAVALVLEPGKLVALLDLLRERGALFGDQSLVLGQRQAVVGALDLDVAW